MLTTSRPLSTDDRDVRAPRSLPVIVDAVEGYVDRAPRHRVTQRLLLAVERTLRRVLVRDRSTFGMLIETVHLKAGDTVTIELPTGRLVCGEVRWTRDGQAGIQLRDAADPLTPYRFDDVVSLAVTEQVVD